MLEVNVNTGFGLFAAGTGLVIVVTGGRSNDAETAIAADIVTTQVPVPAHPEPLQPVNVEPAFATAVSVTTVLAGNANAQVPGQVIPAGALVTVPVPVPTFVTVNVCGGRTSNCALTDVAELSVTTQVPVPEQP